MIFNKFAELCSHQHSPILEHFHHPQKIPHARLQSVCSYPQPQATTNLLSVCIDMSFLDILHKWNHILYDLLCLASFT